MVNQVPPPPPYAETDPSNDQSEEGRLSDEEPPSYDFTEDGRPVPREKGDAVIPDTPASSLASTSASSASTSTLPSSESFFTAAKKKYDEKKKAKEIAEKVDYYEKIYGFVPKNAMTEAEWKRARDAAPKTKAKGELKATLYGGYGLR
ncbi:hypothetical protein F4859DRAFT_386861 [Xylaria cf. heliscus]|nr:hypothetical protein F4859DRAFT_386861 [Xylaria cf. heliscus]